LLTGYSGTLLLNLFKTNGFAEHLSAIVHINYPATAMEIKRNLFIAAICVFLGCVGTEKPSVPLSAGTTAEASCNECHSFPGSLVCKTDSVYASGKSFSECFTCHLGAISFAGTYDTTTGGMVFHDVMVERNGLTFPSTDSMHGNRAVDPVFAQCTFCHGYPPQTGSHYRHVVVEGRKCFECHFASVASDTIRQQGSGADSLIFFMQREHATPLDSLYVPFMKRDSHIDHSTEVSFRKKFQVPRVPDSMFVWNKADASCSNIQCHSGAANGGASMEHTQWR
jgi:hypothetical protein